MMVITSSSEMRKYLSSSTCSRNKVNAFSRPSSLQADTKRKNYNGCFCGGFIFADCEQFNESLWKVVSRHLCVPHATFHAREQRETKVKNTICLLNKAHYLFMVLATHIYLYTLMKWTE